MLYKKKEGEYQRSINCINKNIAGRTKQEHYEDNKEEIAVKGKQYREKNLEIMKKLANDAKPTAAKEK